MGGGVVNFALQYVDCTQNNQEHQHRSHRDAPNAQGSGVPSSTASDTTSKALASATEGIVQKNLLGNGVKASCVGGGWAEASFAEEGLGEENRSSAPVVYIRIGNGVRFQGLGKGEDEDIIGVRCESKVAV